MSTEGHAVSRRTLLRGAGLLGLGGLLSGCGSAFVSGMAGTGPPGNTLSYWNLFGGGNGVRMLTMQQGYQKQHPGINLDAVTLAWGNPYYTKLSLATLGNRPPDVGISHLSRASILAHAGLLEPLHAERTRPVRPTLAATSRLRRGIWRIRTGRCTRSRSIPTRS